MSGAVASYIEESENAEQRFASVQWLDHMAHHIQGDDPELSYFFGTMCYPLYLGEDRYEDALWAAQQELRILRLEEDSRQRQFNALSFIRDIAAQLHDTETSEKAAAEIAELHLSAEEQLSDLSGILLGYITDRCDFEGTKSCVEQILQLAEEIGEPMKLASAYSNFILLENAYWIDCNSAFYLEKRCSTQTSALQNKRRNRSKIYHFGQNWGIFIGTVSSFPVQWRVIKKSGNCFKCKCRKSLWRKVPNWCNFKPLWQSAI